MVVLREICVHAAQAFVLGVVAVKINAGIGRVIKGAVKVEQLFPGQIGYVARIAAVVDPVGGVGKQNAFTVFLENAVCRGIDAFHFIEHHSFVDGWFADGIHFVVPGFLFVGVAGEQGVQHRVHIDIDEVVKVLKVLARHRVAGLVGIGKRVQKGLQ